MFKNMIIAAMMLGSIFTSGCGTSMINILDASDAEYPVSLSAKPGGVFVRRFKTEIKSHHFIGGYINLMGDPQVKAAIDKEMRSGGGKGVNNLKLTTCNTWEDRFVSGFTFGIYQTQTVIVEGDIIK